MVMVSSVTWALQEFVAQDELGCCDAVGSRTGNVEGGNADAGMDDLCGCRERMDGWTLEGCCNGETGAGSMMGGCVQGISTKPRKTRQTRLQEKERLKVLRQDDNEAAAEEEEGGGSS